MNYTVTWSEFAEPELAIVWMDAPDRTAVTLAAAEADRLLAESPFQVGRPHGSSVCRLARHGPLGIIFDIIEDDKKVIVQTCWLVG